MVRPRRQPRVDLRVALVDRLRVALADRLRVDRADRLRVDRAPPLKAAPVDRPPADRADRLQVALVDLLRVAPADLRALVLTAPLRALWVVPVGRVRTLVAEPWLRQAPRPSRASMPSMPGITTRLWPSLKPT